MNDIGRLLILCLVTFITAVLITIYSYLFYKIRKTDYSDQTGWMNFRKPVLGCILILMLMLSLIGGIGFLYYIFKIA